MDILNKALEALRSANTVSKRPGRWATIPEVKAFASEQGLKPSQVHQGPLEELVKNEYAERRYPISNINRQYRVVGAGGLGGGSSDKGRGEPQTGGGPRDGQEIYVPPIPAAAIGTGTAQRLLM